MKFKFQSFLLIAVFSLLSFTPVKNSNKDFVLVSASKRTVYGGVEGSPITTRYIVKLKSLRNFTLIKDSAFAEGKIEAFEIQADTFTATDKKFLKKGHIVTIGFTMVTPTSIGRGEPQMQFPGSPDAKVPVASKTGIVIRYKGGKSIYFPVENIKTEETIYAP